jgi:tRNA pseudouridine13 synthase
MSIAVSKPYDLPRLSSGWEPLGGTFVQTAAHFYVEEIPAYLPSGEGEHLFIEIEKQNNTTRWVCQQLENAFGLSSADVGVAGQKDRHATTRQWLSLRGVTEDQLATCSLEGVAFLRAMPHQNKLRTGHMQGNRFRLLLEDKGTEAFEQATAICEFLKQEGLPNFYGPQRFGREGSNHLEGARVIRGERRVKKNQMRFLVSSFQSACFNDLLAHRIQEGFFSVACLGDRMVKHETGGKFWCEDPEADQLRMNAFEISPTGLMPGYKVDLAQGVPGEWEQAWLAREGMVPEDFRAVGKIALGTRRPLRVPLQDLTLTRKEGTWQLAFSLPSGAYASMLLHELGIVYTTPTKETS